MMGVATLKLASRLVALAKGHNVSIATAESCTGGLVGAAITAISGSSVVYDRGFITYSNEAKIAMLGVDADLIAGYGAVSAQVARAMATGALLGSNANLTVAVTGIAGPDGGTSDKPVGLVHFAAAFRSTPNMEPDVHDAHDLFGDIGRDRVREQSVDRALHMMIELLEQHSPPLAVI